MECKELIQEVIKHLCEIVNELQVNDCDTDQNLEAIKDRLVALVNTDGSETNG